MSSATEDIFESWDEWARNLDKDLPPRTAEEIFVSYLWRLGWITYPWRDA